MAVFPAGGAGIPGPRGAPGDPPSPYADHGYRGLPGADPSSDQAARVAATTWYQPGFTLRNRGVIVQPNTPTIISSRASGRKFVQAQSSRLNSDNLYWGGTNLVRIQSLTGPTDNMGLVVVPGGSFGYEQQEYDGDIWVITAAGAGVVLVVVADPVANL